MKIRFNFSKFLNRLYIFLLTVACLYFGMAEVTNYDYYDKVSKINAADFEIVKDSLGKNITFDVRGILFATRGDALKATYQSQIPNYYKWLFNQSDIIVHFIASCFFGILGSIVRLLKIRIFNPQHLTDTRIKLFPVFGMICGFLVVTLSYAIPTVLTLNQDISLNPLSVMVVSLFAGMQSLLFYKWLNNLSLSVFNSPQKTTP